MHITVQGTNLEVTHELRKFIYKKVGDCKRALGDVNLDAVQIDIEIERTTRRHPQDRNNGGPLYRAEANVKVPGRFIRVEEFAMHLEPAIVKMKNTLTRSIRHWREQWIDRKRNGARKAKEVGIFEPEPLFLPEDEWVEPPSPPSPYAEFFEQNKEAPLWKGVRDDARDLV